MSSIRKTRTAVAASNNSSILNSNIDDLRLHLHSPIQFADINNQYLQLVNYHSSLIDIYCSILNESITNVDRKVIEIILDSFLTNSQILLFEISDLQFKQDLLPFIKRTLTTINDDENENLTLFFRFLIAIVEHRSTLITLSLTEWLSSILTFVVTRISSSNYLDYGDLIIDLLTKISTRFTPLPKEIVDILGRSSSSIISTNFLLQLKTWIKHTDDTRLALFAIHLWTPLAALLNRLLSRGHTKGNEMLAIIQDGFIAANYSVRSAAFSAWGSFMSHVYRSDTKTDEQQLNNRLLKLFLTPFLPDYTSKNKSASIAKCRSWLILISIYPNHIEDVLIPFFSFTFGSSKSPSWWSECRQIGFQYLYDYFLEKSNSIDQLIKLAGEQILNSIFDIIFDELEENKIEQEKKPIWLNFWHFYLTKLTQINNCLNENQHIKINTCLLTRIEQLWIDSRMPTNYLIELLNTFEQTGFPLGIEIIQRDSNIRTKTLSATQNYQENSSISNRTTLSDQYLHMMLEHAKRFNDNENDYCHIISYLIDTLSKISDDYFCFQTCSLLIKCSVELQIQPLTISILSWHIWSRCSTHLIIILNRIQSFRFDIKNNQQQETSIELLLRPFAFGDTLKIDYSLALLWTQLFKTLSRLALLDDGQSIELLVKLLRHGPAFEQAVIDENNQRLFGFLLVTLKILIKTLSEIDSTGGGGGGIFSLQKRSSSSYLLCLTQLTIIINCILKRILLNNENNLQWIQICSCLIKTTNKLTSSYEQLKSIVFIYIRDLIIDLLNCCKTCGHLEILLSNLTHLYSFILAYEQLNLTFNSSLSSPISTNKQQDNLILVKILSTMHSVFNPTNASTLLQLIFSILILAFQHTKTGIRNKTRKYWNETFGRLTFLIYPNELRSCLRDLKDKEHLLLPCFLADHDNSNTIGSGPPPSSTDESQLSQQVDIATPIYQQRSTPVVVEPLSSPVRFLSPALPSTRSATPDTREPVFVPIKSNINHNNRPDSPVVIGKRTSSIGSSGGLTEKQKEKLRTRQAIPLLCDDSSHTQSNSQSILLATDTPTIESLMATYQLRSNGTSSKSSTSGTKKQPTSSLSLFKQPTSNSTAPEQASGSAQESSETEQPPPSSSTTTEPSDVEATPPSNEDNSATIESDSNQLVDLDEESANSQSQGEINDGDEDMEEEESSIAKKLRRSRRPSTSARKSFGNGKRKKPLSTLPAEVTAAAITAIVPTIVIDPPSSSESPLKPTETKVTPKVPAKSILKRLSPTRPRTDHTRHVAFHDQVKVLLFASPSRRETTQQRKKSPIKEDASPGRIIPRENLPLRQQPMATRRLSAMIIEPTIPPSAPTTNSKTRSSKLFHPKDALADWSHEHSTNDNNDLSELTLGSSITEEKIINESPTVNINESIFPPLVDCDKPIDTLIHVLFGGLSSTTALNYFRTIKINTVGDLARSTPAQIEVYPIPTPKSENMRKALSFYHDRLFNSPSLSPIVAINGGDSLTPIASTSDEPIAISDGTFTKESSSLPPPTVNNSDPHDPLYDVDTMIDSLDYERLYLNDNDNDDKEMNEESPPSLPPASTSSVDYIRTRRQAALAKRPDQPSPPKRRLSPTNEDDEQNQQLYDDDDNDHQISPKQTSIQTPRQITLGERLQKAADTFAINGVLPFDDDYIELVRHLLNNQSLSHLEQLHLKTTFFDHD